MMRPDAKVEKVYLYPKPVDFRKSIDGLAALVELDIKVAVFDPVLFVFLNKPRNRVKILYWERNGFCLWLKRLESERFKTSPDATDEAIVLTVQELNCMSSTPMRRECRLIKSLIESPPVNPGCGYKLEARLISLLFFSTTQPAVRRKYRRVC
ncbi:IS66 family insertion sequence element accessory protein TnpB [Pseudomonas syringae]|uniref:IS66 family insertion sequence element accessory protein TnpB n=1 Tax=Pseudomonas syringae TaxID=317 RepID=UPI000413B5EC